MSGVAEFIARGVLIGVGGSALMDVWALVARRAFGIRGLDYGLLGRWIGHFPRGRFVHERVGAADPVRGERAVGWAAHYSIGVAFSFLLLAVWGLGWARSPAILPPMLIGLGTVVAPWFVLQPGMGSGVAASRTPDPRSVRLRNLATHAVYGVGLYASAVLLSILWA
jgi:hypothetical protein